jgi:hypothetical protein
VGRLEAIALTANVSYGIAQREDETDKAVKPELAPALKVVYTAAGD